MRIYALDRAYCQNRFSGNFRKMIEAGEYVEFDDNRIRRAFNFGNGTEKDMNRFMRDNNKYCRFYDAEKSVYLN